MAHSREYSDYDSSEEEDEVNENYFAKLKSLQNHRSAENIGMKPITKSKYDIEEP